MTKPVRITAAEIEVAKMAAEDAGLRLVAIAKSPDGTMKFEFGESGAPADWRDGSPLYAGSQEGTRR